MLSRVQPLLQREPELAVLERAVTAAQAGAGGVTVLEGPAGIGKTSLLSALRGIAADVGLAVHAARGGELEREFPFGVARQLLEPALSARTAADRESLLAGAAGLAAPVLSAPDPRPSGGGAGYAVMHGLYWLIANLAAERPLLLAVDDAHWSDPESAEWLLFLARRIDELPVLIAVATRPHRAERGRLDSLVALPHGARIEPSPLNLESVRSLLAERLGDLPEGGFDAACHAATGGNPFELGELIRSLTDGGVPSEARLGARGLSRSTMQRLAGGAAGAPELARAASVLGAGAPLHLAARLAGIERAEASAAVDTMAAMGVLATTDPIEFAHPLLRAAIYESLPAAARADRHAEAAALMHELGSPPEAVAAQLLRTRPAASAAAVERLRAAAAEAFARGAPQAGARYLARALEEPPSGDERAQVLQDLGMAELLAHDPAGPVHLAEALAIAPDPRTRAASARVVAQAYLLQDEIGRALRVLEEALEGLGDDDGELRLAVYGDLLMVSRVDREGLHDGKDWRGPLRVLLAERPPGEDSRAARLALAQLAMEEVLAGDSAAAAASTAQRALAGGRLLAEETAESAAALTAIVALMVADEIDAACEMFDLAIDDARRRGSAVGFVHASTFGACAALRAGALADAEAHASAAIAVQERPIPPLVPLQVGVLLDVKLERGELDAAELVLVEHGCAGDVGHMYQASHLLEARGRLHAACGRHEEALADLLDAGRRQLQHGMVNPTFLPWRSAAALAHLALGDRDAALTLAGEEVAPAERFGAPRALGIALRAQGLILGGTQGLAMLERAAVALAGSPARLDAARAAVTLGSALRRANRRADARGQLVAGLDAAQTCGATALAATARSELEACGVRPRGPRFSGADALTASEQRVARMAATGMANREIAQALFVTTRTVENHLARAYGKLGIHSRGELAAALGRRS